MRRWRKGNAGRDFSEFLILDEQMFDFRLHLISKLETFTLKEKCGMYQGSGVLSYWLIFNKTQIQISIGGDLQWSNMVDIIDTINIYMTSI